ncbi:MAG: ABC transporter substrate-binding protein [Burkholderiaceae bacterium]|nr:ABC transporter substrate-binding protein [Burkholderiaceae bacterium]
MNRRTSLYRLLALGLSPWVVMAAPQAWATTAEAPDAFIQRVATTALDAVRADPAIQAGDFQKVMTLVDGLIMPNVNFPRMTASAVGRHWRQATPAQQQKLQDEFKVLLVRTYSGALAQVKDQTLTFRPLRAAPGAADVIVRSDLRGRGDPIQLDYRVEKVQGEWKIYDLNVMGIWLVETYRTQFAQVISSRGIDGLIDALAQRNQANAARQAG